MSSTQQAAGSVPGWPWDAFPEDNSTWQACVEEHHRLLGMTDRYELADAILRAWKKHGHDSWCSIADDVIKEFHQASSDTASLVARYRRAVEALEGLKSQHFYRGLPVTVDCDQYKGPGFITTDGRCRPDQVAVRLPNGNTWWYGIEHVRPQA